MADDRPPFRKVVSAVPWFYYQKERLECGHDGNTISQRAKAATKRRCWQCGPLENDGGRVDA